MLNEGDKLPKFKIDDQNGKARTIKDLAGKNGLILYAYPKDNTSGCTVEAQDFRDLKKKFAARGFNVVGISKDSAKSHCNFIDKHDLNFTLLSDPDKELLEAIGAWGEKKNYGKVSMGTIRSTFVADAKGEIIKVYKNVKARGHAEKVLEFLKGL